MSTNKEIGVDESIAAVRLHGLWRFFYDSDYMFLLDYASYTDELPLPGESRYETVIVDESNAELWMQSLSGELRAEDIPKISWRGDGGRAKLTFVIDFDRKLWVGWDWNYDQSPLTDYQPDGWIAIEDDVYSYVPDEIARLWIDQLNYGVVFAVDGNHHTLFPPKTRTRDWGSRNIAINIKKQSQVEISITKIPLTDSSLELVYNKIINHFPKTDEVWLDLNVAYSIALNKQVTINLKWLKYRQSILLGEIDEFKIK